MGVNVTNTGLVAGDEVVQLYLTTEFGDPRTREMVPMPAKQLRGFRRVTLEPGESAAITLALGSDDLAFWSVPDDSFRVETGVINILVAAGLVQPKPKGPVPPDPVSAEERQRLAELLGRAPGKPLSEIVIEERGEW